MRAKHLVILAMLIMSIALVANTGVAYAMPSASGVTVTSDWYGNLTASWHNVNWDECAELLCAITRDYVPTMGPVYDYNSPAANSVVFVPFPSSPELTSTSLPLWRGNYTVYWTVWEFDSIDGNWTQSESVPYEVRAPQTATDVTLTLDGQLSWSNPVGSTANRIAVAYSDSVEPTEAPYVNRANGGVNYPYQFLDPTTTSTILPMRRGHRMHAEVFEMKNNNPSVPATTSAYLPLLPPAYVSLLEGTFVSHNRATASWHNNDSSATVTYLWTTPSTPNWEDMPPADCLQLPGDATSAEITVSPGQWYCVKKGNEDSMSITCSYYFVPPPAAPTSQSAIYNKATGKVNVSWLNPSSADGTVLWLQSQAPTSGSLPSKNGILLSADTTSTEITMTPGVCSWICLARVNAGGNSSPTAISFVVTKTTKTTLTAPTKGKRNVSFKVTGSVPGAAGKVKVYRYWWTGHIYKAMGTTTVSLSSTGKYTVSVKPTVKGKWRFRAFYLGYSATGFVDPVLSTSWSSYRNTTVK